MLVNKPSAPAEDCYRVLGGMVRDMVAKGNTGGRSKLIEIMKTARLPMQLHGLKPDGTYASPTNPFRYLRNALAVAFSMGLISQAEWDYIAKPPAVARSRDATRLVALDAVSARPEGTPAVVPGQDASRLIALDTVEGKPQG